jgi:hypothetical protein
VPNDATLDRIACALEQICAELQRLGEHNAADEGDVVGTPFVAEKLGCTTVWVAEMARTGEIPKSCIVPGTGNGKPWKFSRQRITGWLNKR